MQDNKFKVFDETGFLLTKENYFSREASKLYMGSTQYKEFLDCEARAVAKNNGKWVDEEKDTFLIGKAVHAWNEGTLEKFLDDNKDSMMTVKKDKLLAKFDIIFDLIEALKKDDSMLGMLEGKKEVMFTAEMFGINWKIAIDSYREDLEMLSDLKTMKSLTDKIWIEETENELGHWGGFIEKYNYLAQMAIYAEVERIANNRDYRFTANIVAVSKEKYPDKKIITFDDDDLKETLKEIENKIGRVAAVWKGGSEPVMCGQCEYCRSVKKADIVPYKKSDWKMKGRMI